SSAAAGAAADRPSPRTAPAQAARTPGRTPRRLRQSPKTCWIRICRKSPYRPPSGLGQRASPQGGAASLYGLVITTKMSTWRWFSGHSGDREPGFSPPAQPLQHRPGGEAIRHRADRGLELAQRVARPAPDPPVGLAHVEAARGEVLLELVAL